MAIDEYGDSIVSKFMTKTDALNHLRFYNDEVLSLQQDNHDAEFQEGNIAKCKEAFLGYHMLLKQIIENLTEAIEFTDKIIEKYVDEDKPAFFNDSQPSLAVVMNDEIKTPLTELLDNINTSIITQVSDIFTKYDGNLALLTQAREWRNRKINAYQNAIIDIKNDLDLGYYDDK